jgi:alpha-beta hydrolase superfamily lysophospholipase
LEQWLRMFVGTAADPGDVRRCGTYQQLSFPSQQEPLLALDRALGVRSPDVIREMKKPGDVCRVDREDIAAMVLWETGLTGHAAEVRRLAAQDYLTVRHEAPGAGRLGAARQAS